MFRLWPEFSALALIALPLAWLTWRSAGVDAGDQAVVFGWVLGWVAVASVALPAGGRVVLPWPALLIALIPVVQLLPLGVWGGSQELLGLIAAQGIDGPQQISVYPYGTIRWCFVLGGYCALFAVARAVARGSVRAFLVVAVSLLAKAVGQAVLGVRQHLASQSFEDTASLFAHGTFVNRDHFAALMEGCFGLAVGLALATLGRRGWKRWLAGRESTWTVGALLAAGACGMAVVFSYSRMGIIVLAAMTLVAVTLALFRNRMAAVLLAVSGVAAALVVSAAGLRGLWARFGELIAQQGDPSRLSAWRDTLWIVPEFAWTGSGLGTFAFVFRRSEAYLPLKGYDHAHSDFLELLLELGVPGAVLLFGVIGWIFVDTVRKVWVAWDARAGWMTLGCLLGAGGILLHAVADFPLQIPAVAGVAAVLLGSARGLVKGEPARPPGRLHRAASGTVCGALCLVSVGFLQGRWASMDAEVPAREARSVAMQGAAEEAEVGYVAALNANPFAAAVWLARGELAEAGGRRERALEMFELARRLEPFTLRTEWALGNAYLRQGNIDKAAEHFRLLADSIPEMRATIFDTAWRGGMPAVQVAAKVVPETGEAAGLFLSCLVRRKAWDELAPVYATFDDDVRRSIPAELMEYTVDRASAAGEAEEYRALWERVSRP